MQGSLMSADVKSDRQVSTEATGRESRFAPDLLLLSVLFLVEILTFGPFVRSVGFYLDDWLMLQCLHFGPHDVLGAFANYFFHDPKVIIRPIEVLHFAPMYLLFGLKPLGYHLVNGALELLCIGLLYASVKRFSDSRLLAFTSACFFVIYPIRDSTHYWILCSSVALSLALYLGSLMLSMRAVAEKRPSLYLLSTLPFAFSIYNYEVFMPFALLTFCLVYFIARRQNNFSTAVKQAGFSFLPLFASGCSLYVYQRMIVPHLGESYMHKLAPEPAHILHVISSGAYLSSPLHALPFLQGQMQLRLTEPFSVFSILTLCLFAVAVFAACHWLIKKESLSVQPARALELAFAGVVAIVFSLAIFGLNKEYEPTLMTLVNRIFAGPAVGWSFIFAALMLLAGRAAAERRSAQLHSLTAVALALILSASTVCFTITNWQFGSYWQTSCQAQRDITYLVKAKKDDLQYPASLILAGTPRYVMWAPVFDGIWDFQSMVRMTLEDSRIAAGVATERLQFFDKEMKDISMNYVCGIYPYEHLKVLIASGSRLVSTPTAGAFVNLMEEPLQKEQLAKGAVEKWRRQLQSLGAK